MILEISVLIIAVFVVIFVIGLLIALSQIRRTAKEAEKFIDAARQQIVPIGHEINLILNDAKKIVQSIERQVNKVEEGVNAIKDTALKLKRVESEIRERIEYPLMEIMSFVSAIARVINGIVNRIKK